MPSVELDFTFDGNVVGYFEGKAPRVPGRYRYMPYRNGAHYQMHMLLRAGGTPRCSFEVDGERVTFSVLNCPESHILELADFEIASLGTS